MKTYEEIMQYVLDITKIIQMRMLKSWLSHGIWSMTGLSPSVTREYLITKNSDGKYSQIHNKESTHTLIGVCIFLLKILRIFSI